MNATRTKSKKSGASQRSRTSSKSSAAKGRSKGSTSSGSKGRGASAKSSRSESSSRGSSSRGSSSRGASSRGGSSGRGSRTPIGQAIEMLAEDHKMVQKLFRQGERAKEDPEQLREIVEMACQALTLHAEIEEQHFYPVMREAGKETEMIAEAEIEHASAKQLIAQLQGGDPEDETYAAMFKVLGEYVKHHIKEEENEIFPKARRARGDFEPLLQALQAKNEAMESAMEADAASSGESASGAAKGGGRGRKGGARRSSRSRGGEDSAQAGGGGESGAGETRRSRRGESADSGESESAMTREQDSGDEGNRSSRQGRE
jgi:hemerythrin superfamily protein